MVAHDEVPNQQVQTYFFEGAEKLFEIWFTGSADTHGSLRDIPRYELEALLDKVHCQIVAVTRGDLLDSYVLSESSMFVADTRFILKTCGTTHLMEAVHDILLLANKYANLDVVMNIYYSRKNFVRPELQPDRHQNFDLEIKTLDGIFENGAAYCMGRMNCDRWYLYTLNPPNVTVTQSDQTLEMLMSDLDPATMRIFSSDVSMDGRQATKLAGIDQLLPEGTIIDDKLFEPCGYSMNAIVPHTDHYATIHVTPEPQFSYVSFETNVHQSCMFDQSCKVLECFKPGRFLLTLFANDISEKGQIGQQLLWERHFAGYKRKDLQFLKLPADTLVYAQYVKSK